MKKLLSASLILIAIICFSFQNKDSITLKKGVDSGLSTPSVFSEKSTSDTMDLDEEMRLLEKEMHLLEGKMKPHEEKMKAKSADMKPHEEQMRQVEQKMKPLEKQMRTLEKKMKGSTTEDEREKISNEMSVISDKMSEVGNEMSAIGDKMSGVGDGMSDVGNEMSKIGDEMSKIGDKMSIVGDKMEIRHKRIFTWFFNELKRDGLVTEGKCSIVLEKDFFIINSKNMSKEQMEKYKKGIEKQLGKALNPDFYIFFKGTLVKISDSDFEFNGTENSNY